MLIVGHYLYSLYTEEHKRFSIFLDNMKKARKIQYHEKGTAKYGVTKFSDMPGNLSPHLSMFSFCQSSLSSLFDKIVLKEKVFKSWGGGAGGKFVNISIFSVAQNHINILWIYFVGLYMYIVLLISLIHRGNNNYLTCYLYLFKKRKLFGHQICGFTCI